MARGPLATSTGKKKSQNKPSVPQSASQEHAAPSQTATRAGPKRYQVPADFQESSAPLRLDTDLLEVYTELWLFQLPHELDPAESLTWQISTASGGGLSGTCQDSEGVSYTLTEEPSGMATQVFTTPAVGSSVLSRFKRRVTVVKANQLPDALEAAKALEAVIPSADMPGIPAASQSLASLTHQVPQAVVQKQQQQQDQQAEHDLLATPQDPKHKDKKAKVEAKKLKKRAQEATAINEKQSKVQRQSDAPVLDSAAVQVSPGPDVKSEAAHLQEELEVPASTDAHKDKKSKKEKKEKKVKPEKKKKHKHNSEQAS